MSLAPGVRLGAYEVSALIGAGGMGEVYRATDGKLHREVALKVLPDVWATDPDRLTRFEREAKVLATLNDPHIAAIYGVEESNGVRALVLELVEGPTLADRIAQGPMAVDEALPIARQIAEALEVAHDQGVIHRDLKPANIKLRADGTVKVLDFGLARIYESPGAPQQISQSPTFSAVATLGGVILGTAAYMSPEQARGKAVDQRADIWAFGCVLFELLTGRQTFPNGETVSDTLVGVLAREPDWQALPASTPPKIRMLLERCLRKDARRRLRHIGDARIELEDTGREHWGPTMAAAAPTGPRRREYGWAALSLVLLLTIVGVTVRDLLDSPPEAATVRFDVFASGLVPGVASSMVQLSPDGRMLAFAAQSESKMLIWTRPLDSSVAQAIPASEGTDGRTFWSADSQQIGFFADGKVKTVAARGGPSQILASLPTAGGYSGTWNAEGVILVALSGPNQPGPLLRLSGGDLVPLMEVDASRKETAHKYPSFLPDGRHYLYVAVHEDLNRVAYVGALDSNVRTRLPGIASEVKYSSSGHLLFIRDGALMAEAFDVDRLELIGEAFAVTSPFVGSQNVTGHFSVSLNGTLAYRPSALFTNTQQIEWFDRTGKRLGSAGPAGQYADLELSLDDNFVAFEQSGPGDIWVIDLARGVTTRVTSDAARDSDPVWSPDGRSIAFKSTRDGGNIYQRAFGTVGADMLLLKSDATKDPSDWSRDGRYLTYESGGDVWVLPLFGDRKPLPVTETPFTEGNSRISPNGRWVAYQSTETGAVDVYVQALPGPGAKQQVSIKGGTQPRWSRDGKELFYLSSDFTLMAVSIQSRGAALDVGPPMPLFETRVSAGEGNYTVSGDGRFLLNIPAEDASAVPITVILNWASGRE